MITTWVPTVATTHVAHVPHRGRCDMPWWSKHEDLHISNDWQRSSWYPWVLTQGRLLRPNGSCSACFPPLSAADMLPLDTTSVVQAETQCLLRISWDQVSPNKTAYFSASECLKLVNQYNNTDSKHVQKSVGRNMCNTAWFSPDKSTDRSRKQGPRHENQSNGAYLLRM